MLNRLLKAEFFEIDHVQEKERSKDVKSLFEYHLNEALKIVPNYDNELKIHEIIVNIRSAVMDKDSKGTMEHLMTLKKTKNSKKIYDIMKLEIAEYSSHPDFELTPKHLSILLGFRIRKYRENLGVTALELGEKIDIDENHMCSVERGDKNLHHYKIVKLVDIFGVTLNELYYGTNERRKKPLSKEDFKYPPL